MSYFKQILYKLRQNDAIRNHTQKKQYLLTFEYKGKNYD